MARPNTIRQSVREEAARAINRRMEQTHLDESELELARSEWNLDSYNDFFSDCRTTDRSTSRCGAIWTTLKERGDAPTDGEDTAGEPSEDSPQAASPALPIPSTVEDMEEQFLAADAVYMVVTTGCPSCEQAKEALQDWIDDGTIEVTDVQTSDKAADIVMETGLDALPALVIESDGEFTPV